MSVTNLLNGAGWGVAYGCGLWGAGLALTAVGRSLGECYNVASKLVTEHKFSVNQKIYTFTVIDENGKPVKDAEGCIKAREVSENAFKAYGRDFIKGVGYAVAGLVIRQLVARAFSPTPPDFIVQGIACFGWTRTSSPLIERMMSAVSPYLPCAITIV